MTAIVLPDLDRSTLEDLKHRMPSLHLSEIELPSMEHAGRRADEAIDRLLGRSRPPIWPWIAGAIGLAAIVGVAAALMSWTRRPGNGPWSGGVGSGLPGGAGLGTDTGIGVPLPYGEPSLADEPIAVETDAFSSGVEVTSLEEPRP